MDQKKLDIMISEEEIQSKIKELGKIINKDYEKEDEIFIIGVLKGASVFLADLIRQLNIPNVFIDFMAVSSYGMSTESSGVVRILKDLDLEIQGKHVLIVEDIIDTGLTLKYLIKNLETRNAESIKICTLLDKPSKRKCDIKIHYCGFVIEDKFIVGYGIDFAEKFRNLPYIASVE